MFSQYFGQYLFNEGILTAEQLYNIFEYKESIKVKLGTLAMTSGLMTAAQVEEVLDIQKAGDYRRFGEIAINKGYLTIPQVEQLLNAQKNTQVNLSQAIADQGYMSLGELERHLGNFYHQQGSGSANLSSTQLKAIEDNDIEAVVRMFLNFSEFGTSAPWCYQYIMFTLRNASRFFGENPAIRRMSRGGESSARRSKSNFFWLIIQNIPQINLRVAITMDEGTLLESSRRFSKKAPLDISATESSVDIITKYFNIHNIFFLSSTLSDAENSGVKYPKSKLPAPEVFRQKHAFASAGYRIPIVYSFGQIDILLEKIEDTEDDEPAEPDTK